MMEELLMVEVNLTKSVRESQKVILFPENQLTDSVIFSCYMGCIEPKMVVQGKENQ